MNEKDRISINVDKEIKDQATALFEALGMNLTTAITLFLNQSIQDQALPFQPHLKEDHFIKPSPQPATDSDQMDQDSTGSEDLSLETADSQERPHSDLILGREDTDRSFDIWFD